MRLVKIAAALAIALFATSPVLGSSWDPQSIAGLSPPSCTLEQQRCLERLEQQLQFYGDTYGWTQVEDALLELQKTHPECPLLLQGTGLHGL